MKRWLFVLLLAAPVTAMAADSCQATVAPWLAQANDASEAEQPAVSLPLFERAGWLLRSDIQFHWENRGYAGFEDFLGQLASRKRKVVRKRR